MADAAVGVAVAIVDGLYAAARRGIVLSGSDLELAAIRKRPEALYQPFAERTPAHNGSAVEVLERAADYFRRRGCARVDEHYERELGVDGGLVGLVDLHVLGIAALRSDHGRAARDEDRDDADGLLHQAAAVAAKVEDEPLHTLLLEGGDLRADLVGDALGEAALGYVAGGGVEHPGVFDVGQMDFLAGDGYRDRVGSPDFLHEELDLGAGSAAHLVGAGLAVEAAHGLAVDGENLVAGVQTCLHGRRTGVGLVDDDVALEGGLVDDGAHSAVDLADLEPEVFLLFFGHIDGVGIEFGEHRVDGRTLDLVDRQAVHIGPAEFLHYGVVDLHPLAELEILGFSPCGERNEHRRCYDYYSFHTSSHL